MGCCYVCKDTDEYWYRVRVHGVDDLAKRVTVYYMDLAKMQNTSEGYLLELREEFAIQPAQLFCCYLYDVVPLVTGGAISSSTSTDLTWSRAACDVFKSLVQDRTFTGYVFERSTDLVTEGLPDFISTFGVVLQEDLPGSLLICQELCTLNAQMVDAGFAKPIGIL